MASTQPQARQRQQRHGRASPVQHVPLPPCLVQIGYELVQNAPALAVTRHGSRTLQLLTEIRVCCYSSSRILQMGSQGSQLISLCCCTGSISNLQACCCTPAHAAFVHPAVQTADARSREMLQDIVCYASKTLQGHFGQLAVRAGSRWCMRMGWPVRYSREGGTRECRLKPGIQHP